MYEILKKNVMKKTIVRTIATFLILVAYVVFFKDGLIGLVKPVAITTDMNFEEYEGKVVTYTANCVLSEYVRIEERDSKTRKTKLTDIGYFLFDEEGTAFFGIQLDAKEESKMDLLMDESIEYFVGETDILPEGIKVKGTLTKLTGEDLRYFNETLDYLFEGMDDVKSFAIPYTIIHNTYGGVDAVAFYIIGIVAIFVLLYFIYLLISFLGSKYAKKLEQYLEENPSVSRQAIEADFEAATNYGKDTWVGKQWTIFITGVRAQIHANKDIVWAYYKRTGKHYVSEVRLFKKDKTRAVISIKEKLAMEILEQYQASQPHMITGYDKELEKLYNKDLEQFLAVKYNEGIALESEVL